VTYDNLEVGCLFSWICLNLYTQLTTNSCLHNLEEHSGKEYCVHAD